VRAPAKIPEVRAARERAQRARAQARWSADVAWRCRCDALALLMRTRELAPPLRFRMAPEISELKRLRRLVRSFAGGRGADTDAVVLVAHEAVAQALIGSNRTTEPIDVELRPCRSTLELRVRTEARAPAEHRLLDESASGFWLVAELADGIEVRPFDGHGVEIRARFRTPLSSRDGG
jgi:hypothetical protein